MIKVIEGTSFLFKKEGCMWCGYELTESGAMFYNGFEAIAKTRKAAIQQCENFKGVIK